MSEMLADDIQTMLLDSARDFLGSAHSLKRTRQRQASGQAIDPDMWRQMAELGWLGLCLPESQAGSGLQVSDAAELAALFGAALLPEPFASCAVAPACLLRSAVSATRHRTLTHALADGGEVLALAWQGRLGQIDAAWEDLSICEVDGTFELSGTKVLVEAGATLWLVTGHCDGEPTILVVPADTPAVVRTEQRMADGGITVGLDFQRARVDAAAVLLRGKDAMTALDRCLDEVGVVLSAQLAGIAAAAMELSITYLAQRVQFGKAISDFQVIRHRLVELDLQKRLAFASWRHAARLCSLKGQDTRTRTAAVSAAKARCSETAMAITRAAIQFHGAFGYTQEADIGLFLGAALRHASAFGNAEAHRKRFAAIHLPEEVSP